MRLITIPMSHYCEKARWGLTHAGVKYHEEAHLQVFHYRAVRRLDAQGMVPVLVTEAGAVADSTAILQFLDERLPEPRKLYPEPLRKQIELLEEWFDEGLGIETRRWVYSSTCRCRCGRSSRPRHRERQAGSGPWRRCCSRPCACT